jgi:hypothetical protein
MSTSDANTMNGSGSALLVVGVQGGVTVIPQPTPLTRLNYFDGKFLRAKDLEAEQRYLRSLVALSNQAGGAGVVTGLDTVLISGSQLRVGAGMAIDTRGRVLLLPELVTVGVQDLINAASSVSSSGTSASTGEFGDCVPATQATGGGTVLTNGVQYYVVSLCFAEAYCGQEDVFGKLCDEGCATSTDRPYRVEGVALRAIPLDLGGAVAKAFAKSKAVALGQLHTRSVLASAFFAAEKAAHPTLISGPQLRSNTWCLGSALEDTACVPIAVIARQGTQTLFLDPWIARRERIETPPRRYWAWRMSMRPWDVYLAQILQFQCQLHDLGVTPPPITDDPCKGVLDKARSYLEQLAALSAQAGNAGIALLNQLPGGAAAVQQLKDTVQKALAQATPGPAQILIDGGIVELPSAGYLPVDPGSQVSIDVQVRQLMGNGVDLQFCAVRHDYVAHALEEAQHMDRISLLDGLDDPNARPEVTVLVPDGTIDRAPVATPGLGFDAEATVSIARGQNNELQPFMLVRGAARAEALAGGGAAFYLAAPGVTTASRATAEAAVVGKVSESVVAAPAAPPPASPTGAPVAAPPPPVVGPGFNEGPSAASTSPLVNAAWAEIQCVQDPFSLGVNGSTPVFGELLLGAEVTSRKSDLAGNVSGGETGAEIDFTGRLTITSPAPPGGVGMGTLSLHLSFPRIQGKTTGDAPADVTLSVTFRRVDAAPKHTIQVELVPVPPTDEHWRLLVAAQWSDDATTAAVISFEVVQSDFTKYAAFGTASAQLAAGRITLLRDDEVFNVDNDAHKAALGAIDLLSDVTLETAYRERSRLELFPEPDTSGKILVHGPLDWVLFHRRRRKDCAPAPLAVTAPPVTFQVFQIGVRAMSQLDGIRSVLRSGNVNALASLRKRSAVVGNVVYAGGSSSLKTPTADVLTQWKAVNPQGFIIYGVVAAIDPVEATKTTTLLERALTIERVYDGVTPMAGTTNETLPGVPSPFATDGADGFILVVTSTVPPPTYGSYGGTMGVGAKLL